MLVLDGDNSIRPDSPYTGLPRVMTIGSTLFNIVGGGGVYCWACFAIVVARLTESSLTGA